MVSWASMQAITFTGPPHRPQVSRSILKTCFRRCAHLMATWRSMGDLTSVLSMSFRPLPRLAGVTSPRQRWLDARTPWYRVRLTLGFGTRDARRAMKSTGGWPPRSKATCIGPTATRSDMELPTPSLVDQSLEMAVIAAHLQESVLQMAALQVSIALPADIVRQESALPSQLLHQGWVVRLVGLVEKGLFGLMAFVGSVAKAMPINRGRPSMPCASMLVASRKPMALSEPAGGSYQRYATSELCGESAANHQSLRLHSAIAGRRQGRPGDAKPVYWCDSRPVHPMHASPLH